MFNRGNGLDGVGLHSLSIERERGVAGEDGYVSDIHHKKPKGRPMSEAPSRANGRRFKIRAFVEHVFAPQKSRFGLFVRTIGMARARDQDWHGHRDKVPSGSTLSLRRCSQFFCLSSVF